MEIKINLLFKSFPNFKIENIKKGVESREGILPLNITQVPKVFKPTWVPNFFTNNLNLKKVVILFDINRELHLYIINCLSP